MGSSTLVVGAGSSGLVAASRLAGEPGSRVTVVDAFRHVGGAHQSVAIGGFLFDPGLFLFTRESPFFTTFALDAKEFVSVAHSPRKILDGGDIVAYPFDAAEHRRLLSDWRALGGLAWGRLTRWRRADARQWAEYYLGSRVLSETGLIHYMDRFNRRDAAEIHPIFCERRMSDVRTMASPRWLMRRMFGRRRAHGVLPSLVRPRAGFGSAYQQVREHLESKGVEFVLGEPAPRIAREDGAFTARVSGRERTFSRVVWTAPLELAHRCVDGVPEAPGSSLRLVALFFSTSRMPELGGDCLYNFTSRGAWKRLTLLSDYYGEVGGRSWFTVEVNALPGDTVAPEQMAAEFLAFGDEHGWFDGDARHEGSHVIEHAYPLYLPAHVERMALVTAELARQGIECIGKQGRFDYIASSAANAGLVGRYLSTGRWRDS